MFGWMVESLLPLYASQLPKTKAIEVLLKARAYIVKKLPQDGTDPSYKVGQVTWSKFGGPEGGVVGSYT